MRPKPTLMLPALLLALLLAAGCADEPGDADAVDAVEPEEAEVYEGLSPEEIREAAEPMSPERAEALGIVDTTILIENPTLDTLTDGLVGNDTLRREP